MIKTVQLIEKRFKVIRSCHFIRSVPTANSKRWLLQCQTTNWGKRCRSMDATPDLVPTITEAPSEAKQIREVRSTSSSKPRSWRHFINVSVMQAAVVCSSSIKSRKKRNRFVWIDNSNTGNLRWIGLVSTESLLTVVDSSISTDTFLFCLIMCSFAQSTSHAWSNVFRDCGT